MRQHEIFERIAHEALLLHQISDSPKQTTQKQSSVDSSLFLIKYLLILREQINPFKIQFSMTDRQRLFLYRECF